MRVSATPFSSVSQLHAIDRLIEQRPDDLSLRFGRACCLDDLGRTDEAVAAYLAVLEAAPRHFGALTNVGTIALERGDLNGAFVRFLQAVAAEPDDALAHLNIARCYVERADFTRARMHYERALALRDDPNTVLAANNGLALSYEREGDEERADEYRRRAFAAPVYWNMPYHGTGDPIRVIVLTSPRGGDLMSNAFFDDRVVQRIVLMPEAFAGRAALPAHDLIFNVIGEPERNRRTLERAGDVVATTAAPVINPPAAVLQTTRDAMMTRLAGIPHVVAPRTQRYPRALITVERLTADGYTFPLLLRAPGFHGGEHFAIATRADLDAIRDALPGEELYAIAFVDTRGADGWACKARVAFVDREPYPVHLALGRNWKIHYYTTDMHDSAAHRDEERRFLDDMPAVLGADGMAALHEIARRLDLDYGGIDFGRLPNGDIVVFEANATIAIAPPSDDPRWDYRRPAIDAAIGAVRRMIVARGRPSGAPPRLPHPAEQKRPG